MIARVAGLADSTDLPVMMFPSAPELRAWLERRHESSEGIWVRIYRSGSGVPTVTFEEVLEEGLCFGWSESKRIAGDEQSYLQRFTPRRKLGTTSERNRQLISRLIAEDRMTPSGLRALGIGG